MVLKRLLVTTLSALGLGALAAGTASGQSAGDGNIPAPNIFDDQITCSMNVPSMTPMPTQVPMGGMTSPLDDIIGMGETVLTATGADALTGDALTALNNLGYVIPADGMNCGRGVAADAMGDAGVPFNAVTVGMEGDTDYNPGEGAVATDVAAGYTAVFEKFEDVYGAPGVARGDRTDAQKGTAQKLAEAQKALSDQIKAGVTGTGLTSFQNAVNAAQTAHDKARAAFTDIAGGPINQAGVAEWMAKAAVSQSIADYNAQVTKTNMAKETLDGSAFSMYIPLGNTELITTVVTGLDTGMGMAVLSELTQYINGDLSMAADNTGTQGMAGTGDGSGSDSDNLAPMGSVTTGSNFDAAGKLIIPMEDNTATTDNALDIRPTVVADGSANLLSAIRTRVEQTNAAAAVLKKLRDDNVNPVNQATFNEAYRRAQAEADYYNEQWTKVLADTSTDFRTATQKLRFVDDNGDGDNTDDPTETTPNTAYVANPITIASRNAAYTTESNKRFTQEQNLRSAVAAREMATAAVQRAFNSPQSFYEQLVARRTALKVAADRAVAKASENGGSPTDAQTKAATDAAKALADAREKQADFDALFDNDDDPTVALLNELIKTGGDDGQALVDAISATYDTAAGAADAAREVVDELTGEGGAVATNTADIAANKTAIGENADGIAALDGRVTQNEDDIASNTMMIGENRGMIMTNTENIAENASNIMTNTTMIGENRGMIETNADGIMTNAGHIMENRGMIETNTAGISSNADAIAANMNSIGQNSSAISDNRNMIGELSEDLDVVRAGVAASMALAGMPAINGRGISIGVGSFDGESAFAVGFQIQGDMASFKVGVTSASGATGASAGVGFQF